MTLRKRAEQIAHNSGLRCYTDNDCKACVGCDKQARLAEAIERESKSFAERALRKALNHQCVDVASDTKRLVIAEAIAAAEGDD